MKQFDPTTDPARLAALLSYDVLDTPAEPGFDDIVQLTSAVCEAPVALVSLVDQDRQWFKARIGFDPCQTDLDSSVCRFALTVPDLLVIPDLTKDERTRANPLVTGEPRIAFYAGAPLRTPDGHVLGSLCAIDTKPRPGGLTDRQESALRALARQVMGQLNLRRALSERNVLLAERQQAEARRQGLLTLGDRLRELESAEEMTGTASAIVGDVLGVLRVGFGRLEEQGRFVLVERDWTAPGIASVVGRHRFADYGALRDPIIQGDPLVIEDVTLDPRTAADPRQLLDLGIRTMVNLPVRERGETVAVLFVHADEPRAWPPEVMSFLRNVADRVEVGVARLRAEAQQRVLNQELSHRMKNTFAMVQAIASQTLKTIPDQAPVEAFTQRLLALSSAHDVLLQRSWATARFGDVVRNVLTIIQKLDRFRVAGPDITIGPRATLSLSLLLHELSTNALKYGALLAETGRVSVRWRIARGSGSEDVVLVWSERGGPPPRPPDHSGFGSRLIRMGLIGTGGVDLRYPDSGFQARFRASLDHLQQS